MNRLLCFTYKKEKESFSVTNQHEVGGKTTPESTEGNLTQEATLFLSTVDDINDFKNLKKMFTLGLISFRDDKTKSFSHSIHENFIGDSQLSQEKVQELASQYGFIPKDDWSSFPEDVSIPTIPIPTLQGFKFRYFQKDELEEMKGELFRTTWSSLARRFRDTVSNPKVCFLALTCFPRSHLFFRETLEEDTLTLELFSFLPDSFFEEMIGVFSVYFQSDVKILEFIKKEFGKKESDNKYIHGVSQLETDSWSIENLIRKEFLDIAMQVYAVFAEHRSKMEKTDKPDVVKESFKNALTPVLEKVKAQAKRMENKESLFLNTFKTMKQSKTSFRLDEIKSSAFEVLSGGEISEKDIATMRLIYSENQAGVGAHSEILSHFDERVHDKDASFYIFKWQGEIQSFVAFEPSKKIQGALEATSLNVSPQARGYKIGEAMLEEAIAKEAQEHTLEGECYANLSISAKYIETGWVAYGYFEEQGKQKGDTDCLLNIVRDERQNTHYWSKDKSHEAIILQRGHPETVTIEVAQSQAQVPFKKYLGSNDGTALTRMFTDSSGLCYAVFEKVFK